MRWFKHLGAWVVDTTSSDTKAEAIRTAGADAVISYGQDYTFLDELMKLTDGQGVHLAIDSIGAATLENTIKGLARGGTAVSIDGATGPAPAIDRVALTPKANRLAGGSIFVVNTDPAEFQQRAAEVIQGLQEGWLNPGANTAYPLAQVADAHRALESRTSRSKLYLTV